MISIEAKMYALLVQWVKRFRCSPSGWVSLLTYWCFDRFGVDPYVVFANPFYFSPDVFPVFYRSLFYAWRFLGGVALTSGLAVGSFFPSGPMPVETISSKVVYVSYLSSVVCVPRCVSKFSPIYSNLDWVATWSGLSCMPLDRHVFYLNWQVAHGVLFTVDRLISFGYNYDPACFCGFGDESLEHLFFSCPLVQQGIARVQSALSAASPLGPVIDAKVMLFGFSSDDFRCVPHVFAYLLNVLKFLVWKHFRFRDVHPSGLKLLAQLRARISFFLPLFFPRGVVAFLRASGALGAS